MSRFSVRNLARSVLCLASLCSVSCQAEPEMPIEVSLAHSQPSPPEAEPFSWSTETASFQVSEIAWVNSVIELHLCETNESPSLVKEAEAHVANSPTRLGVPSVESFIKPQVGARVVGEISPPKGTFCRGYLVVSAADEDVVNLTDLATQEVVHHSFVVIGEYRPVAGDEWIPFSLKSDKTYTFEFPLFDPSSAQNELSLKPGESTLLSIEKSSPSPQTFIQTAADLEDPEMIDRWIKALGRSVKLAPFK